MDLLRQQNGMWSAGGDEQTAALMDALLADEVQHVRYANRWLKQMARENPRTLLQVATGVQLLQKITGGPGAGAGRSERGRREPHRVHPRRGVDERGRPEAGRVHGSRSSPSCCARRDSARSSRHRPSRPERRRRRDSVECSRQEHAKSRARSTRSTSPWWLAAPALLREIEEPELRIASDSPRISSATPCSRWTPTIPRSSMTFPRLYGDCAVSAPDGADGPAVRCTMRRSFEPQLVVLTFQEGHLRIPRRRHTTCCDRPGAFPLSPSAIRRSRAGDSTGGSNWPVLAASRRACPPAPEADSARSSWSSTSSGSPWAPNPGCCRSTAPRWRSGTPGSCWSAPRTRARRRPRCTWRPAAIRCLGDEIALIRLATGEIVPFRRTVNVRPGPRGRELAAVLGHRPEATISCERRVGRRIESPSCSPARSARTRRPCGRSSFWPDSPSSPSVEPFQLTLDHANVFDWITTPEIAYCSWGSRAGAAGVPVDGSETGAVAGPVLAGEGRSALARRRNSSSRTMEELSC